MIVLQNSEDELLLQTCFSIQYKFRLFLIAETVTTIPTETNQKLKPAVTKTAVSASQTQMKTGIDKYTFYFIFF